MLAHGVHQRRIDLTGARLLTGLPRGRVLNVERPS
jgi:hypothetical protein